ncbi:hypothetical protein D6783_00415 [Candidatus Woesearchaeota archaeon]|nr:MAG: hypothetical protein D6783_00415 [Candidatus Woesearchaeota archaeon]
MHRIEREILKLFKRDPNIEVSTGDVVREVLEPEYALIKRDLHRAATPKERRVVQRKKAGLHRKVLYHLSKLVEDGILQVAGSREKGEKVFRLGLEEGDYIIEKSKRRIIISKPANTSVPMEGLEHEGVVAKFEPETWVTRLNAFLLQAQKVGSIDRLVLALRDAFAAVNDVVGVGGFESFLPAKRDDGLGKVFSALEEMNLDAGDYHKRVCLLIDVERCNQERVLASFLERFANASLGNISLVLQLSAGVCARKKSVLAKAVSAFCTSKVKLNVHNKDVLPAPLVIGRGGVYAVSKEEWESAREEVEGLRGFALAQSSVAIDAGKLFSKREPLRAKGSLEGFDDRLLKVGKSLFRANVLQRQHAQEYFGALHRIDQGTFSSFFRLSRCYVRLWNYDWERAEEAVALLERGRELLSSFCHAEETVFKACGMPVRFRIALSSAFGKFDQEAFSVRTYQKSVVRSIRDLQSEEGVAYLRVRERLAGLFSGGDRVRFFRHGSVSGREVVKEWGFLLSEFDLPCFTYDFRGLSGNLRLTSYLS